LTRKRAGTRDPRSGARGARSANRTPHPGKHPYPRARKRFGQHFLEPAWAARLIDAVGPAAGDTFVEIGPGRGALTMPLSERAGRVIAVEVDRDLAAVLAPRLPPNVRLVEADFLQVDLGSLIQNERTPVRVIGNLPYNVASPILFRLLDTAEDGRRFSEAVLMLQREVAARVLATPGASDYGALSIQVQLLADVGHVLSLPPGAFRPPPKVESAVVRLRFRPPQVEVGNRAIFARIVRGLFLQRRKTLTNALKPIAASLGLPPATILERASIDGGRRPETLSVRDVARLSLAVL